MSTTDTEIAGVLVTEPFSYQSVEEMQEVYLAKFQPAAPLAAGETLVNELYLNFGPEQPDVREGERITVRGELAERALITRSGKTRRNGVFQILVRVWNR